MDLLFDSGKDLYANMDGTPFLEEEFLPGSVFLKSGEVYTGEFRYDIYADQVQFVDGEKLYCLAFPGELVAVKIGETMIKFLSYGDGRNLSEGYLITLVDGYYSLYVKLAKNLNEAVPEKPYQPARPPKFVNKPDNFYIMVGDSPALRVKGKKELIQMFQGKESIVKDFIDEEGIKTNNRFDLIKLVTFMNSGE